MKTAVIFVVIVIAAFSILFMATNQNPQDEQSTNNFLTPTPSIPVNLNITTAPTAAESERISATSAIIKTEKGDIELALYAQDAPKTVMNFATHAKNGYYDDLTFHRVEPGFVIQGGDPSGNGTGGTSIYGEKFEDELNPNTASYKEGYKEGVLAMANSGPNTNGSQFFIMLADNPLPNNYTIFGKVTSGMDVVKQIEVGDKMTKIEVK